MKFEELDPITAVNRTPTHQSRRVVVTAPVSGLIRGATHDTVPTPPRCTRGYWPGEVWVRGPGVGVVRLFPDEYRVVTS